MKRFLFLAIMAASTPCRAETPVLVVDDVTSSDTGRNAFSHSITNLPTPIRRSLAVGNSLFSENWIAAPGSAVSRDGLGPIFNARSCSSCHLFDGRGAPPEAGNESPSLLIRISIMEGGKAVPHPVYGDQIQQRALPGFEPEARVTLQWSDHPMSYADGSQVVLRKPVITLSDWRDGEPGALLTSPRIANAAHGLGLLETVPDATLRSLADPDDADGDGISGRPNMVWDKTAQRMVLGRFGWKANQPSLRQQTADAFAGDIGITSPVNPHENYTEAQRGRLSKAPSGGDPELPENLLAHVVTYLRTLAPPARRDRTDTNVRRGTALFTSLRCAKCHVPTLQTGNSPNLPELANKTIHPYTDLLLHDMGDDLADGRPDGEATGSEWRTPPLWGMGLQAAVNDHTTLLHDGRARNAEEAILWHSGEATTSRRAFQALPAEDRAAVLAFLSSL
jgi:CxxC motif-containing protein (DUF1111 family)